MHNSNIIAFVDYFQDDKLFYLVTELPGRPWQEISGPLPITSNKNLPLRPSMDLFQFVEGHPRLLEIQVRLIFRQIVSGLEYMYVQGLIHGDIKDENILIDDLMHIKIIDFGSVSSFDVSGFRPANAFRGTLQNAAPEIIQGRPFSALAADVWALGCLFYTLLTSSVFIN